MTGRGSQLRFVVVGAGLSGATLARTLAEAGARVTVFEKESHPAGHCHTERDAEAGIMVHVHGPHILHSDNDAVWSFCERFARFAPYHHAALARIGERHFRLPVNLETINEFFGTSMSAAEAEAFIEARRVRFQSPPANFEEQALASVGPELYEAFFRGYTQKQWGRDPTDIPASVMQRLPVRFDANTSYFRHARVAIPVAGYTEMVRMMLEHPGITVHYNQQFVPDDAPAGADHLFFTGCLDEWFGHRFGALPYRSLRFETIRAVGEYQPAACVNYPESAVPFTRITEHKRLAPWETHRSTICSREFSFEASKGDRPYYPVRLAGGSELLARYRAAAQSRSGVSFVGRLATFAYIDMDVAVARAIEAAQETLACFAAGRPVPAFFDAAS